MSDDQTVAGLDKVITEIIDWIDADRKEQGQEEVVVAANTDLLGEGIFDSMKILEFVTWLENTYAVSIGVEHMTPKFFGTPEIVATQLLALQK